MAKMSTRINLEDMAKLKKRVARVGMTPNAAVRYIAKFGVASFLALLVGATKGATA